MNIILAVVLIPIIIWTAKEFLEILQTAHQVYTLTDDLTREFQEELNKQ